MKILLLLSLTVVFTWTPIARADYAATVLEDKPIAYYRFEDENGTDELADSSGNNKVGWEINNVEFGLDGVAGSKAGEFFGDSSIVTELDFDPSVDGITSWTIETWFYTTGIEEIEDPDNPGEFIEVVRDQQVYISQKDGAGLGRSNILISADRQPGSYIGGGTTNALDPFENDFIAVEEWYHFVAAANGDDDELIFYVNGEPSDLNPQFPGANGIESADGEWVIGSHKNQNGQFFEGLLDEIAFYDHVLSEERIRASRRLIDNWVKQGKKVYGITTGFGALSDIAISAEDTQQLQKNILMSHAAGVGAPLEHDAVRAIMTLRLMDISLGHTSVALETVNHLLILLNSDVIPVVPEKGSVGASGDLVPLAHMALLLIGLGEAVVNGRRKKGRTPCLPLNSLWRSL